MKILHFALAGILTASVAFAQTDQPFPRLEDDPHFKFSDTFVSSCIYVRGRGDRQKLVFARHIVGGIIFPEYPKPPEPLEIYDSRDYPPDPMDMEDPNHPRVASKKGIYIVTVPGYAAWELTRFREPEDPSLQDPCGPRHLWVRGVVVEKLDSYEAAYAADKVK